LKPYATKVLSNNVSDVKGTENTPLHKLSRGLGVQ